MRIKFNMFAHAIFIDRSRFVEKGHQNCVSNMLFVSFFAIAIAVAIAIIIMIVVIIIPLVALPFTVFTGKIHNFCY